MKYFNFFILLLLPSFLFSADSGLVRVSGETVVTVSAPDVTVNVDSGGGGGSSSGGGGAGGTILIAGVTDTGATGTAFDEDDLPLTISTAGSIRKLSAAADYTGTGGPAIVVNADDVTIDLDGRPLRYTAATVDIHGIKINAGVKNTRIKNGMIADFTGSGIYAVGTNGNEIENLTLKNISTDTNKAGMTLDYIKNGDIILCKATGNTFATGQVNGFILSNSSGVRIESCEAYYNSATLGASYGFVFDTTVECVLKNCISRGNSGTAEVAGFYVTNTSNYNLIENCLAESNSSSANEGHGFLIKSAAQVQLKNNKAVNNKSTDGGQSSYGFRLESGSSCFVTGNESDRHDFGFYDDEASGATTNIFISNKARKNTTDYTRPNSSPLNFLEINAGFLQRGLTVSELDNVSITTS